MSKPTILIADDDDRLLKVMKIRFEKAGYKVVVTWNGRRAFELIRENKPDLLILDVDIPGYDGFSLVELMDQVPAMNATPVIYMSGVVDGRELESTGGRLGAMAMVEKPFDMEALVNNVRLVLPEVDQAA